MSIDLINYMNIDYEKDKIYNYKYEYKIDGYLCIDSDLNELLSFSTTNINLGYKSINIFNDSDSDTNSYFGNLIITKNYFKLNFEYSTKDCPGKIKYINHDLYHAKHFSLPNYNNEELNIKLYTCDLFSSITTHNQIYYCINTMLCINKKEV